jgi:hypothetical protein
MRIFSRAVLAAAVFAAAAAYAAAQGELPRLQRTQDGGAAQKPDIPKPDAQKPDSQTPDNQSPGQNSGSQKPGGQGQNAAPGETQQPAPSETKPTVTVFDREEVQGILGKEVRSGANENMGRVVDVIVDRSGQVRAAVIDFGGFLGVGNRRVAVAWSALRFPPDPNDPKKVGRIVLDLTRDQVQAAPEYKEDKPVVLGASGGLESLPFP